MTKKIRKTTSALLVILLTACFALSTFTVCLAEGASSDQLLYVVQLIMGTADPSTVTGVYGLIPDREENPMPVDKDGKVKDKFSLTGNSSETATFTFTEPGVYQYTAGKLKDAGKTTFTKEDFEAGTKDYPLTHIFGFKVEKNANGSLAVIPYTCEDNQATFFKDGRGMTLWNYVQADAPDEPDKPTEPSQKPTDPTEPTKKDEPATQPTSAKPSTTVKPVTNSNNQPVTYSNGTVRTTVIYKNGTPVTTKRAGYTNTGDESHLVLWVAILGVAALGLILLVLLKRRHEDDDEETL